VKTISIGAVGFGTSLLAGLILAVIGHPAPNLPAPPTSGPSQTAAGGPAKFTLTSVSVEMPTSDRDFQGADATAINANCLSCHSAGMVLNQPHLGNAEWTAIVEKMRHAYKAPVPDTDVRAIVDYLDAMKVGQ
jgi:hypothetical protein